MERLNKQDLMLLIQKTNFVVLDLTLYLDTHPDDSRALAAFREHQKLLFSAMHLYQQKYAPLMLWGMQTNEGFHWNDEPWPWQKECDC